MGLNGKTVAITRDAASAAEFISLMAREGASVKPVETITIRPAGKEAGQTFLRLLREKRHDHCVFMSAQSVHVLFNLANTDELVSALKKTNVIAIGPKTRDALLQFGIEKCEIPPSYSSSGLVQLFASKQPKGKRFIIPRSAEGDDFVANELLGLGMEVDQVETYAIKSTGPSLVLRDLAESLLQKKVDAVVFTSASNVRKFFENIEIAVSADKSREPVLELLRQNITALSIGPQTSAELKRQGIKYFEASEHTIKGVADLAMKVLV